MKSSVVVVPNDEAEVKKFAEALGISIERARYIDSMRATYLAWEHDYLKATPQLLKKKRTVTT